MTVQLSKRDKIMLSMTALSEIDDRLAQPGSQNRINLSGAMLASENAGYLEEKCQEMVDWTEQQLLEFAIATLGGSLS